jgi:hypothetical protein
VKIAMRAAPFTRPTIIAAVEFLDTRLTQARFNQLVVRIGLEAEIPSDSSLSVPKKSDLLSRYVLQRPDEIVQTVNGNMTLAEAVVREAVQLTQLGSVFDAQNKLVRGLARDGYVITWDEEVPRLRAALPNELELPEIDDEVHELLKHFGFVTPLGHLGQAIDAHTRGDWAAANGQLRTFLESLFDDFALRIKGEEAARMATSENRRKLLADVGFLAVDRNEWTQDGKNYINGLFKMLHTEGSHPVR